MNDSTSKMAYDVPRGHAVERPGDEKSGTVFLKAERQGTDYIHHYLIQVSPMQAEGLALIYIDPEEMLNDLGCPPSFFLSHGEQKADPGIGHIFVNPKGTFLKVIEDPKSQKMFAFIDIASGEIKRRQDRNVSTVYSDWRMMELD